MGKKDKKRKDKYPFVSICTPTFNRRPFIPIMIKCFENQTYPKDKIEWLILDDGTDKIEDLISHVPQIKYFRFEEKMTLGKKRNFLNDQSKGEIIIYMDDDDYYPKDRISHAVEMLIKSPKALCAGSSAMFLYFKHINKMYIFGPYGPNHATAATFAFKRELLSKTRFDENSSVAEEKKFLKDYTIPFVQLDPKKSIVVFSHIHNSFDKKILLEQLPNPNIHETPIQPEDLVKEPDVLNFFMNDVNILLDSYEPGRLEHKPDVIKQIAEIQKFRETFAKESLQKQIEYNQTVHKLMNIDPIMNLQMTLQNFQTLQKTVLEQKKIIQELSQDNLFLKEKANYLENKLNTVIVERIKEMKKEKESKELKSNNEPNPAEEVNSIEKSKVTEEKE